jgi:pimeloyl-ACP methyl ester carboxylesterase
VLFIHGFGGDLDNWLFNLDALAEKNRVFALDLPGHGQSTPKVPGTTLADLAGFVGKFMDAVSIDRAHLVGHSMGGGIAAAVAARRPELVRAAVLEDPAWFEKVSWEDRHESAVQRVATSQQFRDDYATAMDRGRAENARWPASELDPWGRAKADGDLGFLATGLAFLDIPWTTIAAGISVPTLVVTGTDEVILDADTRQAIADLGNRYLEVAVIADAGHCVRREQPEAYHALVDPWLAAHVR